MNYRYLKGVLSFTKVNYSCRYYSRNVIRRKTSRILNSQENPVDFSKHKEIQTLKQNYQYNKELLEKATSFPSYETITETDSRFKETLGLFQSRKLRERKKKMIIDGTQSINYAIDAHIKINTLYYCHEKDLEEINFEAPDVADSLKNVFKISSRTMQLLSGSTGVIAVFERPTYEDIKKLTKPMLPVTILCDNIRDPGNLGSIIRHAAATGCQNVLLLKGCADPWETKVIKVGCGGHFRIPVINNISWMNISNYIHSDSKIFIADNSSDIEYWEDTSDTISYDTSPKEIDEQSSKATENSPAINELATINCNELRTIEDASLPCYLYSSVAYPRENIVLYVGGETHGVDAQVENLACHYEAKKVKIPLENSMDSLNSAYAFAILLYEIKRQLSEKL